MKRLPPKKDPSVPDVVWMGKRGMVTLRLHSMSEWQYSHDTDGIIFRCDVSGWIEADRLFEEAIGCAPNDYPPKPPPPPHSSWGGAKQW